MIELLNWIPGGLVLFVLLVVGTVALYLLPGLAVIQVLWRAKPLPWAERLAFAVGIGVALPPLLLEFSHLVGLPWTPWTLFGYLLLALLVSARPFLLRRSASMRGTAAPRTESEPERSALPSSHKNSPAWFALPWHGWVLLWLVGLVLLARLYSIRDLPVPMWGDSYQHTMMAQLIVDNHGLFSSWEPYAPLATFTYHFGFHANVAFFHWLTAIPVPQSVLYVGVILNAATVALAYLFTARLSGNRNVALFAALLTGFANSLPGYYVNWGRYPQLTGHVVLPVVLLCWMHALDRSQWLKWRALVLAVSVTAALALTHYIVAIFAVFLITTYLLVLVVREPTWRTVRRVGVTAGIIGGAALLLILPWFLNTLGGYLTRNTSGALTGEMGANRIQGYAMLLPLTPLYLKWYILALAAAGFLLAMARRDWKIVLLAAWTQALILAVIPNVFGLPGAGVVDQFTAYLALYITVVPLAAYTLGCVQERLERWRIQPVRLAALGAIIGVSLWGIRAQLEIDSQYQIFSQADAAAMEWIKAHTPPDAQFLVNSYPAYGGSLVAGTDGGWWIPLLTGRKSSLPPLTYGSERGAADDFYRRVNTLAIVLRGRALTDFTPARVDLTTPAALDALREAGISYVYSGAHPQPGPQLADRIDTTVLRGNENFKSVYASGGVEIFQIVSGD